MNVSIPGVVIFQNVVHGDNRGFFMESYREDDLHAMGILESFVQDNHSRSYRGVIRGLHFQWEPPMGKLMRVSLGQAFLVAVDIRKTSPTLGEWVGVLASDQNGIQMWAPAGFARGFCALSDVTDVQYKCTGRYNCTAESSILWNDPDIGIAWPAITPILSARDATAPTLKEWLSSPESENFVYRG